MSNPISDELFDLSLGLTRDAENKQLASQASASRDQNPLQYQSRTYMEDAFNWAYANQHQAQELFASNPRLSYAGGGPLDHILLMGAALRKLYNTAIPRYVDMIQASALASAQKTPNSEAQKQYLAARKRAANDAVNAFDDFTKSMGDSSLDGTNIRLTMLRGLHAIYSRAKMYQLAAQTVGVPPPDVGAVHAIHSKWLKEYLPGALEDAGSTSKAISVLSNVATISFKRQEDGLIDFETAVANFENLPPSDAGRKALAQTAAQDAIQLGLVVSDNEVIVSRSPVFFRVKPYAPMILEKVTLSTREQKDAYRGMLSVRSVPAS